MCSRVGITRLIAALALTILATPLARADVVTLGASKDNTLYQDANGDTSNAKGQSIFSGMTNSTSKRRAVIAFSLAGQIPAGSTIQGVTLTLQLTRTRTQNKTIRLYRLTADWGEGTSHASGEEGQGTTATTGDATWIYRFYPGTAWTNPGGDYVITESASTVVGNKNGAFTWSSAQMITDVVGWLNTPSTNFGWILVGDETGAKSTKRFASRENTDVTLRPALQVTYTPPAVSGACCLPNLTCAVLTPSQCSAQSGVYQGDATTCSPNPCVVATGSCCFTNGTCADLTAAQCASQSGAYGGDGSSCSPGLCPVVLTPYVDALPIPATAVPISGTPGGSAAYDIAMTEFTQKLHRDLPATRVWGYAGSYPGPVIEAARDVAITVHWRNDLRDSLGNLRTTHYLAVDTCLVEPDQGSKPRTVVHLHGGHVEPQNDGYPEATFLPGDGVTNTYLNHQLPATLWFHDHAFGITRLNVMMGLAGLYLIRDPQEIALGLPSGADEIPLVIQDRKFKSDGSLDYPATWDEHFFGDKILVNGKVWPYLNVKQGKYRFRILNGSNSRVYQLTLSTGDPFYVIGTDGGLLPAPVARETLLVTPGERRDVVVDFANHAAGTEILLVNSAPAPYPGPEGVGVVPQVMKFVVTSETGHVASLPSTLQTLEDLPESTAVTTRDFQLAKQSDACTGSKWMINGLGWTDVTEQPILGTTEIWRFINRSGVVHPMHMHLVQFRILDRQAFQVIDGQIVPQGVPVPPDSSEAGWKDTAPVWPDQILRVIARFDDYTGRYPYHCHVLEHEDQEMMRQFEVVAPVDAGEPTVARLGLDPVRPNPFGMQASLGYDLPRAAFVRLGVYDVAGRSIRRLVNGARPAGRYQVVWDGKDDGGRSLGAGVYLVHLEVEGRAIARKAVILRR